MSNIEVMGLGALNIDYIYNVERILNDGETIVKESKLSAGGSAANTIYGLTKLGISTGLSGVTGDDSEGKLIIQGFKKVGVDTSQVKIKKNAKTGSVLSLSDSLGKRALYVLPGANSLLDTDDLNLNYINQAKLLHISSFADDKQLKAIIDLVRELKPSVKLSFSPGALYAVKGLKKLAPILAKTYILFINQDEIRKLTGKDILDGVKSCLKQGCQHVVVTLGKGSKIGKTSAAAYIRGTENSYIIEPAKRIAETAVDATGAGDGFAAGFIYGILKGKSLKECGSIGDTVAKFVIAKTGARDGFPTLSELFKALPEAV